MHAHASIVNPICSKHGYDTFCTHIFRSLAKISASRGSTRPPRVDSERDWVRCFFVSVHVREHKRSGWHNRFYWIVLVLKVYDVTSSAHSNRNGGLASASAFWNWKACRLGWGWYTRCAFCTLCCVWTSNFANVFSWMSARFCCFHPSWSVSCRLLSDGACVCVWFHGCVYHIPICMRAFPCL